jgi:hypothetical protein
LTAFGDDATRIDKLMMIWYTFPVGTRVARCYREVANEVPFVDMTDVTNANRIFSLLW